MKKLILILTILLLIGCSKEDVNEGSQSCQCTKLNYNDIGIVIASNQITSSTCESVGEYPHDIQHSGGSNFTISCN